MARISLLIERLQFLMFDCCSFAILTDQFPTVFFARTADVDSPFLPSVWCAVSQSSVLNNKPPHWEGNFIP